MDSSRTVRATLALYAIVAIALSVPGYAMNMPTLWTAAVAVAGCALALAVMSYTLPGHKLVKAIERRVPAASARAQ